MFLVFFEFRRRAVNLTKPNKEIIKIFGFVFGNVERWKEAGEYKGDS